MGVTLISLRFDGYDQEEELVFTQFLYEEDIIEWFETDYIPAFSTIQEGIWFSGTAVYSILTVAGVDDNGNPIEATGRVDYLPQ